MTGDDNGDMDKGADADSANASRGNNDDSEDSSDNDSLLRWWF